MKRRFQSGRLGVLVIFITATFVSSCQSPHVASELPKDPAYDPSRPEYAFRVVHDFRGTDWRPIQKYLTPQGQKVMAKIGSMGGLSDGPQSIISATTEIATYLVLVSFSDAKVGGTCRYVFIRTREGWQFDDIEIVTLIDKKRSAHYNVGMAMSDFCDHPFLAAMKVCDKNPSIMYYPMLEMVEEVVSFFERHAKLAVGMLKP